jgi:His-Xaa-Ser system protein HxsD
MNSKEMSFETKEGSTKALVDLNVYPLEAVYGAAYVFIDKAYLFLDSKSSKKLEIYLKSKNKLSQKQQNKLVGEFFNELLNYTLRIKVAKNNKKIREYIVEQALFSAVGGNAEEVKKQDEAEDVIGYEDDPLGIAVPWEEKYGNEK